MARSNIVEKTDEQVVAESTGKVFRPVFAQTPAIPASYDGKYVMMAAIAIDVEANEAQMDAFEASVEAITGVEKCFIMIGPARIPIDRVPADHDLRIGIEGSFRIDPTPEP
jgi:DNA-binding Lrp family transcriptional regulator